MKKRKDSSPSHPLDQKQLAVIEFFIVLAIILFLLLTVLIPLFHRRSSSSSSGEKENSEAINKARNIYGHLCEDIANEAEIENKNLALSSFVFNDDDDTLYASAYEGSNLYYYEIKIEQHYGFEVYLNYYAQEERLENAEISCGVIENVSTNVEVGKSVKSVFKVGPSTYTYSTCLADSGVYTSSYEMVSPAPGEDGRKVYSTGEGTPPEAIEIYKLMLASSKGEATLSSGEETI